MSESKAQRPGPATGVQFPVTEAWRDEVRAGLKRKHWNRTDLARAISCDDDKTTPAAISYVMTKAGRSALVPLISDALGIGHPADTWSTASAPASSPDEVATLFSLYRDLSSTGRARLLERAQSLLDAERVHP